MSGDERCLDDRELEQSMKVLTSLQVVFFCFWFLYEMLFDSGKKLINLFVFIQFSTVHLFKSITVLYLIQYWVLFVA